MGVSYMIVCYQSTRKLLKLNFLYNITQKKLWWLDYLALCDVFLKNGDQTTLQKRSAKRILERIVFFFRILQLSDDLEFRASVLLTSFRVVTSIRFAVWSNRACFTVTFCAELFFAHTF
ncbi:hypothetical protein D3C87_370860 [compost metagenome]